MYISPWLITYAQNLLHKICSHANSVHIRVRYDHDRTTRTHSPRTIKTNQNKMWQICHLTTNHVKDEALEKINTSLSEWIDVAMTGEAPWVIHVDIICGGGNQVLSETVAQWINGNPKVPNRPKCNWWILYTKATSARRSNITHGQKQSRHTFWPCSTSPLQVLVEQPSTEEELTTAGHARPRRNSSLNSQSWREQARDHPN